METHPPSQPSPSATDSYSWSCSDESTNDCGSSWIEDEVSLLADGSELYDQEEEVNWAEDDDKRGAWDWMGAFRRALSDLGTDPIIPDGDLAYIKDAILQATCKLGARPELLHASLARALVRCVWAGWRTSTCMGVLEREELQSWAIACGRCPTAIATTFLDNDHPQKGVIFAENSPKSANGRLFQAYQVCGVTAEEREQANSIVVSLAAQIAFKQPAWACSRCQLVGCTPATIENACIPENNQPAISSKTVVVLADGRWVPAGCLQPGDLLVCPGRQPVRVASVDAWPVPPQDTQSLFELSTTQNFQKWALEEVGIVPKAVMTGGADVLVLANQPAMHRRCITFEWQRAADVSGFVVNPGCWDGDVNGARNRFWKVVVKSFTECGLPVPSRTEELEELLLAFLGYWLGDGTSASAEIACNGDDLRNGVLKFMEKLSQKCGGLGVDTRELVAYAINRDYFFVRIRFASPRPGNTDPLFRLLENLGLSRHGTKVVPPSTLSIIHSLPLRHKLFLLAGGVCSDGHRSGRRFLIRQSLVSKRLGELSRWHCHLGIIDAFAAVGAAAGLGGTKTWDRNFLFGTVLVTFFGVLVERLSSVIHTILPRKAFSTSEGNDGTTAAGSTPAAADCKPPRVLPHLASARRVFAATVDVSNEDYLVVPRDANGQALDVVTASGLWVRLGGTSLESLEQNRIQWAPEALECLEKELDSRDQSRPTCAAYEAARRRKHKEAACTMSPKSGGDPSVGGTAVVRVLKRVQPGGAEGRKTRNLPGVMMALAARAAAPFWCETTQSWKDLHELEAIARLFQEEKSHLTTLSKPVGRFRGGLWVLSGHVETFLNEMAARRGAGHVRAAAALFRAFALGKGCSEMDILDYEVIKKGKKRPDLQDVLEEDVGLLQEALARWLHPAQTDYQYQRQEGEDTTGVRTSHRHFAATAELKGAIKDGLEEGVEEEKVARHRTDIRFSRAVKKQKVSVVEGVAEAAGGLVDNLTPMKITLPLVSKNVKLQDGKKNAVMTMYNTKDIASYFVRKC